MGFLDMFGKKDIGEDLTRKIPYDLKLRFSPYRLVARRSEAVELRVVLKNLREERMLTSVVFEVPRSLGFDQTGLAKVREVRLGYMGPFEEKEVVVDVWGNQLTAPGEYPVSVTAFCHYRDYAHVLNSERKRLALRVV
ncbi:MAG: hypothetical protein AB1468_02710 [Candidatus Micrarchaeota archaeon]